MAGISTTGQPSVKNYTLLKGHLMAAFINPNTVGEGLAMAWREMGNTCEMTLNLTSATEKHYQCLSKVRTADLEYITELDGTVTIRLDEWMFENLAAFMVGEARVRGEGSAIAAGTAALNATGFVVPNPGATVINPLADSRIGGRWYDLGVLAAGPLSSIGGLHAGLTHDRRLYGVTAGSVTITANAVVYSGVPVGTSPSVTQFVVNEEMGMLFVASGSNFENDIIADIGASTVNVHSIDLTIGAYPIQNQEEVAGLTGNQLALALKVVGINGANLVEDELFELTMFQVVFRPDGDLPLFAETELGRFTVTGTLQRNQAADPTGGGFFTLRKVA